MLVLSRKVGEKIRIGDDIEVTVTAIMGNRIRVGITAPQDMSVFRAELLKPLEEVEFDFEAKEARFASA